MENLFLSIKNLECPICFEIFKKPIRIACSNQCTTCYDCFTRLFEETELSGEGKNIGKCFCRGEVIVNDCAPAKAVERMVKNINVLCPNFKNGCNWNCGKIGVDHKTLKREHLYICR